MSTYKLSQGIFSSESDNLTKLTSLFPSAVKDGRLDITALKEELGEFEEVGTEKYELTWAGKQAAKKLSQTDVPGRTLKYVPEDSKDADTTQNLYIEGDNLEVLKLLRQNYYGAVKMIYIDPPYNTGNDFIYDDYFTISKRESDEAEGETVAGERMIVNQKSSNRFHAKWLSMMYPRLKVAKDLLTDDGVIFISIDDNEQANLRKMCDMVFGEDNLVANIVWQKRTSPDARLNLGSAHDFILVYAKLTELLKETINKLDLSDDRSEQYKNPDNDLRGPWASVDITGQTGHATTSQYYEITTPSGVTMKPPAGRCWAIAENTFLDLVADGRIWFGQDGSSRPRKKLFLSETEGSNVWTWWTNTEVGHNQEASKEVKNLLGQGDLFTNPKPTRLIKRMLQLITKPSTEHIILDFFSGSATTAHAVMQLNAEDGGNRKYILVQFPEVCDDKSEAAKVGYANICEIGKERIRRAGEKIKSEIETSNAQLKIGEEPKQVPDIGFRVFRTAGTNIRWTHEALNGGQMDWDESLLSDKDRLDFMPGYTDIDVVYEVLLRQRDIPLSAKIEKLSIGERTYMFADVYVVCLDESVSKELVESLAAIEPTPIKYVLRDSAFDDNISLKDETIRRLEAYIARNSGEQKKAYTVEFI